MAKSENDNPDYISDAFKDAMAELPPRVAAYLIAQRSEAHNDAAIRRQLNKRDK